MIAFSGQTGSMPLESWDRRSGQWVAWARAPGHDSYWRFHRDDFLRLVPPPGRLTLEIGCGEGRVLRDLVRSGHQAVDSTSQLCSPKRRPLIRKLQARLWWLMLFRSHSPTPLPIVWSLS